jgi:hypothetical protein
MSKMRTAAIAAIAAALSLSVMSVAQAQGSEKTPAHKAIYNTAQQYAPTTNRQAPALDGALHLNLTWPEGSPDYHGSNGG